MKRLRNLKVCNTRFICPNLIRITLTGKDLEDFPENEKGGYIKLMFPKELSNTTEYLQRPYTIRNFRKKNLELDIDFANHIGKKGLATSWALNARIGDKILISGPGSKQIIKQKVDWFFFIGDMSALPAICTYLEDLNKDVMGIAIIEIMDDSDKIKFDMPDKFKIIWVVNKKRVQKTSCLCDFVQSLKWLKGIPYIWVACEFNNMKILRNYFQNVKGIDKNDMYISSYWKIGANQEVHKDIKKKDNKNWSN